MRMWSVPPFGCLSENVFYMEALKYEISVVFREWLAKEGEFRERVFGVYIRFLYILSYASGLYTLPICPI